MGPARSRLRPVWGGKPVHASAPLPQPSLLPLPLLSVAQEALLFHMPRVPGLVNLGQLPPTGVACASALRPATAEGCTHAAALVGRGDHGRGSGGAAYGASASPRVPVLYPPPGRQICVSRRPQTTQPGNRVGLLQPPPRSELVEKGMIMHASGALGARGGGHGARESRPVSREYGGAGGGGAAAAGCAYAPPYDSKERLHAFLGGKAASLSPRNKGASVMASR